MKERFIGLGTAVAGFSAAASSCIFEPDPIRGTVVDYKYESGETIIEDRIQTLPFCPDDHKGPVADCPTRVVHTQVEVWDAPDRILTLENTSGQRFDVYVWPRIIKNGVVLGQPIEINQRHGSFGKDSNNQDLRILSTTVVE